MSHTPGPWTLSHLPLEANTHITAPNGKMIASIPTDANLYKFYVKEGEANARLIAAAPELLEACKAARVELDAMHDHFYPTCDGGCPADAIVRQLAEVIAKAEGR